MFGIDLSVIGFVVLTAICIGALAYAFLFQNLENETKREQRYKAINARMEKVAGSGITRTDAAKRRKNVQETLKKHEEAQKAKVKKYGLKELLLQAGTKMTVPQFYMASAAAAVVLAALSFLVVGNIYVSLAGFAAGGLGLPRWVLYKMRARRVAQFTAEFPNAVDVIVRGVKSGLPLNDCLVIVSKEAAEPVKSEFRKIIEHQHLGMTLSDASMKLHDSVPTAETNFFGIVIAIQQSAGGNLAESFANLSKVLRDRKKMAAKIKAMSAEAKASAMIIGSLPIIVGGLVFVTTPSYIQVLFENSTGHVMIGAGIVWMATGIFVMKQMINFDF